MNNTLTDRCVNKPNLTHAPHRASSFRLYPACLLYTSDAADE